MDPDRSARQRFLDAMALRPHAAPPLFDEGFRDDVIERWRRDGLPDPGILASRFRYDPRERVTLDTGFRPGLEGRMPCDEPLASLRSRLDPEHPARLPEDWQARCAAWKVRESVLELFVHSGFFLTQGADIWDRVHRALLMTHDEPGRLRDVMQAVSDCAVALIQRMANSVTPDMAIFSEPISGPDRPLLGPRMYRELVLSTYVPIIGALRECGCPVIVFQTYANSRALLPAVVEAGFNCLWAVESGASASSATGPGPMDYREIRREFGRDLRLIGGIDLDVLRTDTDTIRRTLRDLVPPLLADGGYIPLADGRIRADIPLPNYLAYREELERIVDGA
jgi:hypothetical protein